MRLPESPDVSLDVESRENKTLKKLSLLGHDIKCFYVIFVAFHFNSEKENRTNQNKNINSENRLMIDSQI